MTLKFFLIALILLAACSLSSVACAQLNCSAQFTQEFSDKAVDIDGDGRYDILNMSIGVQINRSGEYSLTGHLYDPSSQEIAWSVDHRNLSEGYHTMNLDFDGSVIRRHGVNGRYLLSHLVLLSGSSLGSELNICQSLGDAYLTPWYNSTDFGGSMDKSGDKILSGSGEGELLLTLSIQKTLPVFEGSYSYDIAGLNIPPFTTPFDVISLDPEKFSHGGSSYGMEGLYIPGKPNNFTITATSVKNLNVGLKKLQGDVNRLWISSQVQADDSGQAKMESDLISPNGIYQVRIFGDAAENMSQVDLQMTLEKKIIMGGSFNLGINTTGFPSGSYSMKARAINGNLTLKELTISDFNATA